MSSLRNLLIASRRILSAPIRRRQLRRLSAWGGAPIMVPFYHRVADDHPNPWTIGCDAFERHVDFVRENYELISLDELQRRVRRRDSYRPAVSFTFDDGYADNAHFAIPLLIRHQIPCTYFVSVHHILTGQPFQHDIDHGHALQPNTIEQLRAAAEGGIEIGLHTRTHIDCAKVESPEVLRREIVDATEELSELIGQRIRFFAFPFGMPAQLTQAAIEAVDQAGLEGFCSAFGAYNMPGRDAFHIRRFHGDKEFQRFLNWLEFDSRKLRMEPSVRYSLSTPDLSCDATQDVPSDAATIISSNPSQ